VILALLKKMELIKESPGGWIMLLKADLGYRMVKQLAQEYLEKTERDREKLEYMMRYGPMDRVHRAAGDYYWSILASNLNGNAAVTVTTAYTQ
jgi:hypothetical protein